MPTQPASRIDAAPVPAAVDLGPEERELLLRLARTSVSVAVGAQPVDDLRALIDGTRPPERCAAAFVTLTEADELRGCMGRLDDAQPAWISVVEAARLAALGDPRFRPVVPEELGGIHLEVSVLGPMERLADPAAFRPGVDGLLISRDGRRGLLLPEVADMLEPRHHAMLEAVCRKAGLPPDTWCDAWRDARTELLAFRTCRFGGPVASP